MMPGAEPWKSDGGRVAALLLHGFTGTPYSMRPWAEHLAAAGLTVRLPRLPGHGTTPAELNRTRWQDWFEHAEREFLDLRRSGHTVVVCGLSAGGGLAVRLAEAHPASVAGLALVNPSIADADWRKKLLPVLRWVLPYANGVTDDIAKPGVTENGYPKAPLHAAWSLTQLWRTVQADLRLVTCPLLVFRSTVDHVVPAASTERLVTGVSSTDVSVVELTRSYHVATLDFDAPLIEAESLEFVRRVTGGTGPTEPVAAETSTGDAGEPA